MRFAWVTFMGAATVCSFAGTLVLSGCSERAFDVAGSFAEAGVGGSGGRGDAAVGGGSVDAPVDRPPAPPDLAKADKPGVCIPTGTAELCNGADDDCDGTVDNVNPAVLTTVNACGSCSVVCSQPVGGKASCVAGQCLYECEPGYVDVDKSKTNGCECVLTGANAPDADKSKPETLCDGRDNDCDGLIDEGFDLKIDPNNCGACNKRCVYDFAVAKCNDGTCKLDKCIAGFVDVDAKESNGCETVCPAKSAEVCDGKDNDCNGLIDDGVTPGAFTCKTLGVCTGTVPTCKASAGWACDYSADFQASETADKGCDDKDNDCDGKVDEAFNVGALCSVGIGGCANAGMLVCNPADRTTTMCSAVAKMSGMELCNGVDDDCDGKTDELDAGDRTVDDQFVLLVARNVTMFAYEATRFDASKTSAGMDSSRRPCSVQERLPWANVRKEDALAACQKVGAGWRLCTADEWFDACNGSANTVFPYGNDYDPVKCNGADFPKPAASTLPSGEAAMCLSGQGGAAPNQLLDMSGNVREWVITGSPTANPLKYELRGGAYNVASFSGAAPGLQCDSTIPAPDDVDVRLPSVGFRCCKDGTL